ncbi:hypothetical protein [Alteromonas portus]|uniref:hypothetical protein n=1 Tax=Alteromonas portus TaxID=2565549 RepID=UPI003BF80A0A
MKKVVEAIHRHFSAIELDLRITQNGRFMDQKCTPDILFSISDVLLDMFYSGRSTFTIQELMHSPELNEVMVEQFKKPSVDNPNTRSEYDKISSQPVKMLTQAGILREVGKRKNAKVYNIANFELLKFISTNDRNALKFLVLYLNNVIEQSGLQPLFENFFSNPTKVTYNILKDGFCSFIIKNTKINGLTETRRIFSKVLNPLAFSKSTYGTRDGRISTSPIQHHELFYNRPNFRDLNKPKDITRQEFLERVPEDTTTEIFFIRKALQKVRNYHNSLSEIDRFKKLEASHVHHIFPKHEFPELADTFENLIVITPGQHLNYAHPNGNTHRISKSYQLVAILAKLDSIERSVFQENDAFYDLTSFIDTVNIGLDQNLLLPGMGVEEIRFKIAEHFLESK